jgi:hypothetical protein
MTIIMPVQNTSTYTAVASRLQQAAHRTHLLAITALLKMVTDVFMKALPMEAVVVATRNNTLGMRPSRACGLVESTLSWMNVCLILVVFCTVRIALSAYKYDRQNKAWMLWAGTDAGIK